MKQHRCRSPLMVLSCKYSGGGTVYEISTPTHLHIDLKSQVQNSGVGGNKSKAFLKPYPTSQTTTFNKTIKRLQHNEWAITQRQDYQQEIGNASVKICQTEMGKHKDKQSVFFSKCNLPLSSFSAPGAHQLVFIVYFIVYLVLAYCSCNRVIVCLPMFFSY